QNQAKWLIELTKEVFRQGGSGVIYWEPGWVSSGCRTYWGQGSHYENAAFFDFDHNLLAEGGIRWLEYDFTTAISPVPVREEGFQITFLSHECIFTSEVERFGAGYSYQLIDVLGRIVQSGTMHSLDGTDHQRTLPITDQLSGWVTCILLRQNRVVAVNSHWAGL
ncbi:MAG TPA: glycosyl hydrolase 53 family protein, partial [Saprospiraceae bacterium]|nr:glycosyl hydrolase 53 family protein [Saprospiraceae bacterium]